MLKMKHTFLLTILIIINMATSNAQSVNYTYATVLTQFVEANGIKFAYRSYGKAMVPTPLSYDLSGTTPRG